MAFEPIYLIEDNVWEAKFLRTQLAHLGYEVHIFETAEDALAAAEQAPPAVAIVDIMLPEEMMTGIEAIPLIKQSNPEGVFLFVLSGRSDFQAHLDAVRAGADGYFEKPVTANEIADRIELMGRQQKEPPIRVLVVEEQVSRARSITESLNAGGMRTEHVHDPALLGERMSDFMPDVIVANQHFDHCTGLELASVIRHDQGCVGIPFVFLCSSEAAQPHLKASSTHGTDEFLQYVDVPEAIAPIVRARADGWRQVRAQMFRDGLTGLLKPQVLKQSLAREMARVKRDKLPLCFAMVDIDHFKSVNDTHGHLVGDRVIVSLAKLFLRRVRVTDIVGRYGGEEFGIIMPGTSAEDASFVIDGIRQRFADMTHQAQDERFTASFSSGICVCEDTLDVNQLIARADQALYEAKSGGRNQVRIAG